MTQARIIVSGMVAGHPDQGGATWAVLQFVLGLMELGADVYLIEPVSAAALQPAATGLATSRNARYFHEVTRAFALDQRSALLLEGTRETVGLSYGRLEEIVRGADLLINISGMLTDRSLIGSIPRRVYLDLDPCFNQLWAAAQGLDMRFRGHTHFVTIGQAIGDAGCPVPTCGIAWQKTVQPVVLRHWPVAEPAPQGALTTVANWRGYGSIEHDGRYYGQKAHSLRPLFGLPQRTPERFVLALSIHPEETRDLAALDQHGWQRVDPADVVSDPVRYRRFIQESKAEFGIAKSGYVVSRCGWFSDRSVCYLASGRPVLAQDTGFRRYLPTGEGLFAFSTIDDVLMAIEALNRDYRRQAARARAMAEAYFDSNKVLSRFLGLVS